MQQNVRLYYLMFDPQADIQMIVTNTQTNC